MSVYRKFRKDTILAPITWFFLASMEPVYSPVERAKPGVIPGRRIIGTTERAQMCYSMRTADYA